MVSSEAKKEIFEICENLIMNVFSPKEDSKIKTYVFDFINTDQGLKFLRMKHFNVTEVEAKKKYFKSTHISEAIKIIAKKKIKLMLQGSDKLQRMKTSRVNERILMNSLKRKNMRCEIRLVCQS